MNFIWDIVLQAEEQGMDRSELFFQQATDFSPYCEQAFACINQDVLDGPNIEINALYRFSHIFQELLHPELLVRPENLDLAECAACFFDVVVHLLSEIDLKHGLTKREYFVRQLRAELLNGVYGREAAAAVAVMDRKLQFCLANELLTQIQTGTSLRVFRRAVRTAFAGSLIYQSNYNDKELLLYLGEKETKEKAQIIQFLFDLFLPFGFSARLFWEYHFGIIGVDAAMQLGDIALF
ncbi:hypothetical protein [Sporomusa sphaeroides]|uniref:hypothetical protein n=1 Tax=Sporomusa sphaeroides TaxID=47679 RepID=UPI002BEEB58A|nr:hypothetical protein [Sporomusa sphaeroides]HML32133.1 hypothetical protein [Sporomusa sphaeroides]